MGPAELQRLAEEKTKVEEDYQDIIKSGRRAEREEVLAMERVREYQLNRLKYYYAVTEFDSIETANSVYTECDGKEFESSATRFDLRFIPEDMTFEVSAVASCTSLPDPAKYKPKNFFNSALQSKKVKLTWDEEDSTRKEKMREVYEKLDDDDGDFSCVKGLIASSSSEDEAEADTEADNQQTKGKGKSKKKLKKVEGKNKKNKESDDEVELGSDDDNSEDDQDLAKYRSLLLGLDKVEKVDGHMEVTWEDDMPQQPEQNDDLTPWEKYLKKKKDKRDKKKEERAEKMKDSDEDNQGDDDVPDHVDLDDPFFAEELNQSKDAKKNIKKKKNKKRKLDDVKDDDEGNKDDLALLVMDQDDRNEHFNFKAIVEEEKAKGKSKKKKWNKKKAALAEERPQDNFDVNVDDDRFAAIYERPEFNIDPSEQNFKKTKGMDSLIGEKQKRVVSGPKVVSKVVKVENKSKLDAELSASLKSVKNKWAKNSKKKRKL